MLSGEMVSVTSLVSVQVYGLWQQSGCQNEKKTKISSNNSTVSQCPKSVSRWEVQDRGDYVRANCGQLSL